MICMLSALLVSIAFLGCYLYFHFVVLHGQPTRFRGEGWVRPVYFAILVSHTFLAATVVPWPSTSATRAGAITGHAMFGLRWTLPIWLYVSITGVVVYVLLYHLYPPI